MGFWKNLCCWRKRRNVAVTTRDIGTTTENVTVETGTQVSYIDMKVCCDASTQVDFNVTCDTGTQVDLNVTCDNTTESSEGNEQRKKITDGGAVEEEKEEPRRKIAEMDQFIEEKDRKIQKLQATIREMKLQQRNEIEFIKTTEQMEKSSLLRKISRMRRQITSLQERRPP